jgi:DNA-binding NtrC family response regulator
MEPSTRQIRLLLVDDEHDFIAATTRALERRGFVITSAADSFQALQIIGREDFDACVIDIRMPSMAGDELFLELKGCRPDLPVIVLSGHLNQVLSGDLVERGVFCVLHKPCPIGLLVSQIRQALDSRAPGSPPSAEA